jgi:hypothetical protein
MCLSVGTALSIEPDPFRQLVTTGRFEHSEASPGDRKFVDSPLERAGFELVWGFSYQALVFRLLSVLCSEREAVLSPPMLACLAPIRLPPDSLCSAIYPNSYIL